jgi:CBS domain-containing protein
MSKVGDIMTSENDLFILEPDDPVRKALDAIRDRHIHAVLVNPKEGEATWKIFGRNELAAFMASGSPDTSPISSHASNVMWSASADWSVKECWNAMYRHRVESLPVMKKSRLIGIITTTDLEKHL